MKQSIVDFNLSSMSMEYKREFFYKLDSVMKQLHESGSYVTNFNPDSILIDNVTRIPSFMQISTFSSSYEDPRDLKKANMLWLADLAFCSYLPEYGLNQGLLNPEVLSLRFSDFQEYFPEEDIDFYREVFNMDFADDSVPVIYYSDYINKKTDNVSRSSGNAISYVKSTAAGRAMAGSDNEQGYINYIFITCVVLAIVILMVFGVISLMNF